MVELSVVIPVYNEEGLIHELISRVQLNLRKISENFEIIIVDDGSEDSTWSLISLAAAKNNKLKGIKLSKNFGHHFAITAGLHSTDGEWVVVMDGDLQDRPEVIPQLFAETTKGFDVVFVSRKNRSGRIAYKLAQRIFYLILSRLSGIELNPEQANFSIINRKVVESFKLFPEYSRFYGSTIKWLGFRRSSIEADHGERFAGKPGYNFKKRFKLAIDIIISFSERPLQFAVAMGIAMSTLSIFGSIWIFYRAIFWGFTQIGWASIVFAILFIGGITITILGILGVYIGRIFQEVKRRPLFVISEKLNIN
jgi:dolichol-phosphate mannosyltransferase